MVPRERKVLPAYVIVDTPKREIPDSKECFTHLPRAFVTIPVDTFRCETKCYTAWTTLLSVCKAIAIHKSQGITVGEGQEWERLVITLPTNGTMKHPGIYLAAISAASCMEAFLIRVTNCNDILYDVLMSIGRGMTYDQRRLFEQTLKERADNRQRRFVLEVVGLHPNTDKPPFKGGFKHLVRWYCSKISNI